MLDLIGRTVVTIQRAWILENEQGLFIEIQLKSYRRNSNFGLIRKIEPWEDNFIQILDWLGIKGTELRIYEQFFSLDIYSRNVNEEVSLLKSLCTRIEGSSFILELM